MRLSDRRPFSPPAQPVHLGQASAPTRASNHDIREVNGVQVDVSGNAGSITTTQATERGRGVKALPPAPAHDLLSSGTSESLLCLQEGEAPDVHAFRNVRSGATEGAPLDGFGIAASVDVTFTPIGAVRSAPGLGYGPIDVAQPGPDKAKLRAMIEEAGRVAASEAALREEFGADVKVAEVAETGELVLVRRGHPAYDSIRSAEDVLRVIRSDLRKMHLDPAEFEEAFAKHRPRS